MKYYRRRDIDSIARLQIAIQAYEKNGVYGNITGLANKYKVSRLFIYQLVWQLNNIYQVKNKNNVEQAEKRKEIDRHILLSRLEGKCSLEAISEILKHHGFPIYSVCYISERIKAFAQSLPESIVTGREIKFYLWDEIFTNGQPILVTVEPESLAILKIELATSRDAAKWQQQWEELAEAGYLGGKDVVYGCGDCADLKHNFMLCPVWPEKTHLISSIALF